jgi:hypothetical protein
MDSPTAPPWFDLSTRRLCTVDEARAALPGVRQAIAEGREHLARARELRELVEDQETYYGDRVETEANPERERYGTLRKELAETRAAVERVIENIQKLGGELKDMDRGLVDFCSVRDGAVVYLCWESDEDTVSFWHPLETGYAGRKPL